MTTSSPFISLASLTKSFAGGIKAVDEVNLDIYQGEFFALLGPSGCGKTTLLRMLAGLEIPTSGQIHVDAQDITSVPANKRPLNMVFQSYAVFPHMSVAENVGYGLKMEKCPADETKIRVQEALELVQLSQQAQLFPDTLSGGQRQRVALARALVKRPKVLLLDEPLSALDAKLREAMQNELVRLQKSVGITFIVVTHDQNEALTMASRIAVMKEGRIIQTASPEDLYEKPNSRFVADFIGTMNFISGTIIKNLSAAHALFETDDGQHFEIAYSKSAGQRVTIGIRPERITIHRHSDDTSDRQSLRGQFNYLSYHGSEHRAHISTATGTPLLVSIRKDDMLDIGTLEQNIVVSLSWALSDAHVFDE